MKKKLLTIVASSCLFTSFASNLTVIYNSGQKEQMELEKVQRIDLTNKDGFSIVGKDGSTMNTSSYTQASKIVFGDQSNVADKSAASFKVYPNPTQDALFVTGAEQGCVVRVFDMRGTLLFDKQSSGETLEIPVANYNDGTYVLKVGNQVLKFIKD